MWPALQGPEGRECRSRNAGQRFLDDAGSFSCAGSRCSKLSFSQWFQRLQLHLYGQLRFRLSGSEALCCKAMHLMTAIRELTGQKELLAASDAITGCSKTQWVVICTWAACSSVNSLQYCARTSAHTSTCWQSGLAALSLGNEVTSRTALVVCPFAA